MAFSKKARHGVGSTPRAGFLGFECLRELCLLSGGIAAVMIFINGVNQPNQDNLTTSMKAGAAAEAQPDQPIYRICPQPDQKLVWLKRGDSTLVQVSLESGDVVDRIPIFSSSVSSAAHSLDGRVHACATVPGGITIVRDGITLVDEPIPALAFPVVTVDVSGDGRSVAAGAENREVRIWSLSDARPTSRSLTLKSPAVHVLWSEQGDRLLIGCGDGTLCVFNPEGQEIWKVDGTFARISSLAWTLDGQRIAVGMQGGDVAVLDPADGQLVWRSRHDSVQISAVAFAPDNQRLVVGGFDRHVDILSASNGERLQRMSGHYDMVRALYFLPDGERVVSGSLDGTLRVWSSSEGRELQRF